MKLLKTILISQEERIQEFMKLMSSATEKTGITYAVEAGKNMVVFDVQTNEPVELEITVGTEVIKENGRTSIITFDKSNIENENRPD